MSASARRRRPPRSSPATRCCPGAAPTFASARWLSRSTWSDICWRGGSRPGEAFGLVPSRGRDAPMKGKLMAPLITAALALLPLGCGADTSTADHRQALEDYVAKVQPIRLGINELLDRADPILEGYREGDLSVAQARLRLGRIAALEPVPDEMRAAQDAYAHTFVLQDTYLSALVAALRARDFEDLPHFQNEQRAAIIAWRTRLQVLADRWGATLPANLQVAGRGEISPSPTGD